MLGGGRGGTRGWLEREKATLALALGGKLANNEVIPGAIWIRPDR